VASFKLPPKKSERALSAFEADDSKSLKTAIKLTVDSVNASLAA
jgi:hypothetical protein